MRILFDKYPIDIILCILCSLILIPVSLLNLTGIIRIILGLPFILFIPGYLLIFTLFPKRKTDRGIDVLERISLSFGFSMAISASILFGLNYTAGGIQLESVLISIFVFIIGVGYIALYKWIKTVPNERFIIYIDSSKLSSKNKLDRIITIIVILSILAVVVFFVYAIVNPKNGEVFTGFYLFDSDGGVSNYPSTLAIGENATVKIGLVNHEYQTMDYVIEIWLIDQESINNETVYNHMWFVDKINATLPHLPDDIKKTWGLQWEYNYTFSTTKTGKDLKIAFLLFTVPTDEYEYDFEYRDIAEQKFNSAYKIAHLWIDVI